jgi:hypothetical protein
MSFFLYALTKAKQLDTNKVEWSAFENSDMNLGLSMEIERHKKLPIGFAFWKQLFRRKP